MKCKICMQDKEENVCKECHSIHLMMYEVKINTEQEIRDIKNGILLIMEHLGISEDELPWA